MYFALPSERSSHPFSDRTVSHVFISDYTAIGSHISAENCRLLINSKVYDVVFIDNPMELNRQLEFYLKYTGGQ